MKCDLHRHLGGSISAETVCSLIGDYSQVDKIRSEMTFCDSSDYDFSKFLDKFRILERIDWDQDALSLILEQVCWDIAREQIDYSELKFTVGKYLKIGNARDIVTLIHDKVRQQCRQWNINIGLVLCVKYEASRDLQKKVLMLVSDNDVVDKVVGIDVVGNERYFDYKFYKPFVAEWKQAGKGIVMHVGETQSANNIKMAIEQLKVDRIAHGIRVTDDPYILDLSLDNDVCFDVALTSNICTGVVANYNEHPVGQMIDAGCPVTIGTDDPYILQTTLDGEYDLLRNNFDISDEKIMDIMYNSVKRAFVDITS